MNCGGAFGFHIYDFALMVNSNIWRNIVPLRDTAPQNVSDLEFDLSKSIKAKCDGGIGLPIYDF